MGDVWLPILDSKLAEVNEHFKLGMTKLVRDKMYPATQDKVDFLTRLLDKLNSGSNLT